MHERKTAHEIERRSLRDCYEILASIGAARIFGRAAAEVSRKRGVRGDHYRLAINRPAWPMACSTAILLEAITVYRRNNLKALVRCVGFSCAFALMAHTQQTLAQQPDNQPQEQPAPQEGAAQQGEADIDEGEPKPVEGSNLVIEPHMQADERPTPPESETMQDLGDRNETPVITGAGVGSEVAYASQGVVELGGVLALTHSSQTTTIRVSPSVGYFFIDNLELTLFPELSILHISGGDNDDGSTDVVVGGTLEPSYHLPFSDRMFGFAGIGLGVRYADDPGVDVFLRPRLGLDVMVGRSGIFKPAFFADIGANDGLSAGGFEAAFTVML